MRQVVVIDAQNDFISGSLAPICAEDVADKIVLFLSGLTPDDKVFYTQDWHDDGHCSFLKNGGEWQTHCLAGSHGASIYGGFSGVMHSPNLNNSFKKARHNDKEEYSCFYASNEAGVKFHQALDRDTDVELVGFVSEYCVLNSALALIEVGFRVVVYENLCAYISRDGHKDALKQLRDVGARLGCVI